MSSLSGKRVVIFGCGYVGTALARVAQAEGAQVTALTRNAERAAGLRAEGMATVVADLAGRAWHSEIAGGQDFLLNCVSSGGGELASYRRSYVEGMRSIIEWAETAGPVGTWVYTSSTSVYAQGGGQQVDETAPTPWAEASDRAKILLEAEAQLREAKGGWGRWWILRLAGIYGPGRGHLVEQVRRGEVAGAGERRLNLVHLDDIVSAIRACFVAPVSMGNEIFNVVDDAPSPKAEVVAWLAAELGVVLPRFTGEAISVRRALTPDRIILNAKLRGQLRWCPRHATYREGYGGGMLRGV